MKNWIVLKEGFPFAGATDNASMEMLTESELQSTLSGRDVYVSGVVQRADAENHNGRIYPKSILQREVDRYREIMKENRAFGELDHPETSMVVRLKEASHILVDLQWKGNDLWGKAKLLKSTPNGQIAIGLHQIDKTKLGISSRGMGAVSVRESKNYVDDFKLSCWDLVADPSTIGAFMGSTNESFVPTYNYVTRVNKFAQDILDFRKR